MIRLSISVFQNQFYRNGNSGYSARADVLCQQNGE